jgi:predicted secreted hydrolase
MKRPPRWLFFLLALCGGLWVLIPQERESETVGSGLSLESILSQDDSGFAAATGEWDYRFPADHGGHPDFRSEVWYLTANLEDREGRRYGLQAAFFRLRLKPEAPDRESVWGANQVFRAHFAVTDATRGRFDSEERFSRAVLNLSGTDASPVRVWLEDWSLAATEPQTGAGGLRLLVGDAERGADLHLRSEKPAVLPEGKGLFESDAGSGFHYYLVSRLAASGTLRLDGSVLRVTGDAWLDRSWGAAPLSGGQIALNRFALQLSDGRDILCLLLRRRDGSGTPIPSCLLIEGDGSTKSFRRREIRLEPLARWKSALDGTTYPLRWRLELPAQGLELEISPLLENQALDFATRAWSGAVRISGRSHGEPLTGWGHLELTGYAGSVGGA